MKKLLILIMLVIVSADAYCQTTDEVINSLAGDIEDAKFYSHMGEYGIYIASGVGLAAFIVGSYFKTQEVVREKDYGGWVTASYAAGAVSLAVVIASLVLWHIQSGKHEKAVSAYYNYLRLTDYKMDDRFFYKE